MQLGNWKRACFVVSVVVGSALAFASSPAAAKPFGVLDCVPQSGASFCQGGTNKPVKTFDNVPLDVNLTLPANDQTNLPLVISLHGWGGSKGGIAEGAAYAARGYALLSYTARGFGQSCGSAASRVADPVGCGIDASCPAAAACGEGWIHLGDSRHEVRDSQYLAGLLVDEGIVNPRRIGVTGVSYGGGQSLQLAVQKDRVRLEDNTLVPWKSPSGKRLRIAAAAPIIPWSDLSTALQPNGHFLDYTVPSAADSYTPLGVAKQSYMAALYGLGASNYYAPPGADPNADITNWFNTIQAGEPYNVGAGQAIAQEISTYHSAAYIPAKQPTRTLIVNGTTDDLFPVTEALRFVNRFGGKSGRISQLYLAFGHPRGGSDPSGEAPSRVNAFFDKYVAHKSGPKPLSGVELIPQTCPEDATPDKLVAKTWKKLHPGEVRLNGGAGTQTILSTADALGSQVDPIVNGACNAPTKIDQPGTAFYKLPAVTGSGYTLAGSPTVTASIQVTGATPIDSELAARLWVEGTDGKQRMLARGIYRPSANGNVVFQLHANGWHFAAGEVPKLELLGRDALYARPSNVPFTIDVSNVELRIPTAEKPGGVVQSPAAPVVPAGMTLLK